MIAVIVPGWTKAATSCSWSVGRIWPAAITSCTSVTTTGITVKGIAGQVTSPTIPTLITCASIWPKPATRPVTRRSGTRMPAGRSIGLTTSPGRRANCWTMPSVPATTRAFDRATSASASAASALAFWAGRAKSSCDCAAALPATAASTAPWAVSTATCARSTSRWEMALALRRISSARVWYSSSACLSAPRAWTMRPSASASWALATSICASTSAIRRRAVSISASCCEVSRRKSGWPSATCWLMSTKVSATRPPDSGRMVTVRNTETAFEVEGWK